MSCRNIVEELAMYKRARLQFCHVIGDCASRTQNIAYMLNEGVIELLRPLLTDAELPIRTNSVCCLSRMANHSAAAAAAIVELNVPETILSELNAERNQNALYRRAVLQALKSVAKHTPELAAHIVKCGGLSAFLVCLQDPDVLMRVAACCGIGSIVRSSASMADAALQQGAATLLVQCMQQSELSVKQVVTLTLGDIARYSAAHAESIREAGAVQQLVRLIDQPDVKLKRQSLNALANIASHNAELAGVILSCEAVTKVLMHLCHYSVFVQRQAARLVQEITKHSLELAQIVVNAGGIGPLVQCLQTAGQPDEDNVSPVIMALGYIAGHSPHFSMAIIECKGVVELSKLLDPTTPKRAQVALASCTWALGHIGRHSSEHCRVLCDANVFAKMLDLYDNSASGNDLRNKCRTAMESCFQCCLEVGQLEQLIYSAPTDILEMILQQLGKVLHKDATARRLFLTVGGLKKIQELLVQSNSKRVATLIAQINASYSDEVINFYTNDRSIGSALSQARPTTAMVLMMSNSGGSLPTNSGRMGYMKPQDYFPSDNAPSTDRSTEAVILKRDK